MCVKCEMIGVCVLWLELSVVQMYCLHVMCVVLAVGLRSACCFGRGIAVCMLLL